MKKLFFLLLVLTTILCNSQIIKCNTVTKNNVYYVSFEIRSQNAYPVKMAGIFKNYKSKKFNQKNVELFINSFYNRGIYTPYLIKGYNKMLCECTEDSLYINSISKKNKAFISNITKKLESDSSTNEIKLDTGEKVLLKVLNISGIFFSVEKNNKGIFTTSMEWNINDIKKINKVYIPFDNLQIN